MITLDQIQDCWNQIGVEGDRSCAQLETVIHCRNCPVYAAAGRNLLERDLPPATLAEWTNRIAEPIRFNLDHPAGTHQSKTETLSLILFRLAEERFALSIRSLQEVALPSSIYPLPHRSNDLFLGLANIRGELLLCVSLHRFLKLDPVESAATPALNRLLVIGSPQQKWGFPVDQVYSIERFASSDIQEPPAAIARAAGTYTQGIVDWCDRKVNYKVNYLDANRLLTALDREVL